MQRRNDRFVERLPLVPERRWLAYAATTAFCLAALVLRLAAETVLPVGYPFVSFFPAVILSSFLFGVRPGAYAAILCGLTSWFMFISPQQGFRLDVPTAIAMGFYSFVAGIDIVLIHFMQRANYHLGAEREKSRMLADNRELLFHELQHRVSNNLQVVAAMLALQRRHVADDAARRALDDASQRTALVGRISRALYDPSDLGQSLHAFLTALIADVMEASGRTDITARVVVEQEPRLESHEKVPLALIVAESVSNAIEHGFARRGGTITVTLDQGGGALCLRVVDDGEGLTTGAVPAEGGNLGLKIAHALAGQLGGRFALERLPDGGALARLDLPARAA